jgi:integrase
VLGVGDRYIQTIEDFARYFHRPPDQLTAGHIREYQAYLFRERKLAASTVTQRLAALRFFYTQTMKKAWSVADTPYPKKRRPLPGILSPEEVAHLINSSQTRFHRMVLMTLYGTGARRAELARLQISDIDSRRMVIHIRAGKGGQDRDVMLLPTLLEALRDYWRGLKRKPTEWLFPGGSRHTSNRFHHSPSRVVCVPTCCPVGLSRFPASCSTKGVVPGTSCGHSRDHPAETDFSGVAAFQFVTEDHGKQNSHRAHRSELSARNRI